MVGIFQRSLRLRTPLTQLSFHNSTSPTDILSSLVLRGRLFPICSPSVFFSFRRTLHTSNDGPKSLSDTPPPRRPFCRVTQEDLTFFRTLLPGRAITDPDLLESSNVDWLKSVKGGWKRKQFSYFTHMSPAKCYGIQLLCLSISFAGSSEVLLRPQTTEEVSQILR